MIQKDRKARGLVPAEVWAAARTRKRRTGPWAAEWENAVGKRTTTAKAKEKANACKAAGCLRMKGKGGDRR